MPIPMFDAHCDTINAVMRRGGSLLANEHHLDLSRLGDFAPSAQVFAVWDRPSGLSMREMNFAGGDFPEAELFALFEASFDRLLIELEQNHGIITLCTSADDAKATAGQGKIAAFIAIEGAELVDCSLDKMWSAFERGARIVNITWNYDNKLSGSAMGSGSGLTEDGRAFVRFLQTIGAAVDVSHISERGFWDICEIAVRPVIASHSSSRAICDHPRNLTDAQFLALRDMGGVAGINLCPDFIGGGRNIEAVISHIEHFLSLGGEKAVCLGGDLDGIDDLPSGIRDVRDYYVIYEALLRRGLSESLIQDIFYNNLLHTLGRAL